MVEEKQKSDSKENRKFLRLNPEKRHRIWKKARYAAVALILIILLAIVFGGQSGIIALYRYSRYEKTLKRRLAQEEQITDSLQQVLTSLRNDPEYKERAAREKLRMIEEGEIIFRFENAE